MGNAKHAKTIAGLLLCACTSFVGSEAFARDGRSWLEALDLAHTQAGPNRHVHSYGEVESVEPDEGTVTMRHVQLESPDRSIWMPAMRMVFHTTNRNKLKGIKPLDWVSFEAVRLRNAVMITNIRKVR